MFKFLKEKLKSATSKFSKDIEEEAEDIEEIVEVPQEEVKEEIVEEKEETVSEEEPKEKKGFFSKIFGKHKEEAIETVEEKKEEEVKEPEPVEEEKEEAKEPEPTPEKEEIVEEKEEAKEPEPVEEKKAEPISEKVEEPESVEEKVHEEKEEIKEPVQDAPELAEEEVKKKGVFGFIKEKVSMKKISNSKFEDLFFELELALLENNVAVEVIEKIKQELREDIVDKPMLRKNIETKVFNSLKNSVSDLFNVESVDFLKKITSKKPFIICFIGINGSGKTTTIAKVAKLCQDNKLKVVLAAADTFRAAAIDQLQEHADKLGVKLIKHDYGADAAAVAFDAIKHAESKNLDVVLIDTAGRIHSNVNLMDEMKKIVRVANPDMKIFIGESITGNDCTEQAKKFDETVGIDGIILSKADVDEKGGAAVSVSYVTKKPILFLGTGQEYSDLTVFDKDKILENIGLA